MWDLAARKLLAQLPTGSVVRGQGCAESGSLVFANAGDALQVWDTATATGRRVDRFSASGVAAWSSGGWLAIGARNKAVLLDPQGEVVLEWLHGGEECSGVSWSPDGQANGRRPRFI